MPLLEHAARSARACARPESVGGRLERVLADPHGAAASRRALGLCGAAASRQTEGQLLAAHVGLARRRRWSSGELGGGEGPRVVTKVRRSPQRTPHT